MMNDEMAGRAPNATLGEGRRKNYECRNAEQRHPKPGTRQAQAKCKPRDWDVVSCVPLVLLLCSSCAPLVLPPGFRRPCGVSTAALPGLDRDGLAVIQLKSQSPAVLSDH